jgi:hypothetical protein
LWKNQNNDLVEEDALMLQRFLLTAGLASMLILGGAALAQDAATPAVPAEGEVIEGLTLESITADPGAVYGQEVTLEGVLTEFINVRTFVLSEGAALDDDKVLVINSTPIEFDPTLVTGERVRITGVVMPSYNEGGFEQVIANFRDLIMPAPADTTSLEATPADGAVVVETTPSDATTADATPADDASMEATPMDNTSTDANVTPDGVTVIDATPVETGATPMVATPGGVVDTSVQSPAVSPDTMDFTPLTNAIAERYPEFTIVEITSIDSVMFIPPAE